MPSIRLDAVGRTDRSSQQLVYCYNTLYMLSLPLMVILLLLYIKEGGNVVGLQSMLISNLTFYGFSLYNDGCTIIISNRQVIHVQ